jgi:hypothetical protein
MPAGLAEALAKSAARLRRSIEWCTADPSVSLNDRMFKFEQDMNEYSLALADAIDTALSQGIDDPIEVYRIAWRAQIAKGGHVVAEHRDTDFKRRITNFNSPLFTEVERDILNALVAAYGDDVIVVDHENKGGWSLFILRPEFARGVKFDPEYPISEYAHHDYLFFIHRKFSDETERKLLRDLLRRIPEKDPELPRLHKVLRPVLGEVQVIDGVRHIPVWEGRVSDTVRYKDLPSFGEQCEIADVDALLNEGAVANLLGKNYRIWFDHTKIEIEDGRTEPLPNGERILRVQRTNDPVTVVPVPRWSRNSMLGHGRSQQRRGMFPYMDRPLYCLMVLNLDSYDATHCIMVQLDDDGEIELAWIEVSST